MKISCRVSSIISDEWLIVLTAGRDPASQRTAGGGIETKGERNGRHAEVHSAPIGHINCPVIQC